MISRYLSSVLIFAPILLISCQHSPTPAPEPVEQPAPEQLKQPDAKPAAQGFTSDPAKRMDDIVSRMDFWLELTTPPSRSQEDPSALDRYGFVVTQKDYREAYERYQIRNPDSENTDTEFQEKLLDELLLLSWLEDSDLLEDQAFLASVRGRIREEVANAVLEQMLEQVKVEEADLQNLYEERVKDYTSEEKVQARIILVPTQEEADKVLESLENGESFSSLASEYSRHESRENNGELPAFTRGTYLPELEEVAFEMQPGETRTVPWDVGIFIIEKVAHIPSTRVPFEEVREELLGDMKLMKREQKLQQIRQSMEDR